jgi:nitroreductase
MTSTLPPSALSVTDAVRQRRAVKAFDPAHRLTDTEIDALIATTRLSPTAFNLQHWRFVCVRDPALRREIRAAGWDQAQMTDASALFILCGDVKTWEKNPARYWSHVPNATRDYLVNAIHGYYNGRDQVQRDEVMRSCGIAAMTLMLAAREMGYESCPMDGFDFSAVGKCIRLPADHIIVMMVAVGKGMRDAFPRGGALAASEVLIRDRF